ncbi:MAG: rhomboid family intramembrane serine protease [Flavobacteriales bacterium]|nr:rhomboid family intramembrane serine protease [Flavobacteriales bacterium]
MNFGMIPPVVKRLIILNALVFLFTHFLSRDSGLIGILGLFYFESPFFMPTQLVSHMFTHGGMGHIFFNMFALWMFGSPLEKVWGGKRFLIFYLITGFGAVFLHQFVDYLQIQNMMSELTPRMQDMIRTGGLEYFVENSREIGTPEANAARQSIKDILRTPVVGASGAVFGILAGFAMLFPNTELMLIFFPMPIKAKYFVPIYAAIELILGVSQIGGDNIAHFAHLGGALFGFILVRIWSKDRTRFY